VLSAGFGMVGTIRVLVQKFDGRSHHFIFSAVLKWSANFKSINMADPLKAGPEIEWSSMDHSVLNEACAKMDVSVCLVGSK
jgi:hypothetical protein